jgi:hypothetical protein
LVESWALPHLHSGDDRAPAALPRRDSRKAGEPRAERQQVGGKEPVVASPLLGSAGAPVVAWLASPPPGLVGKPVAARAARAAPVGGAAVVAWRQADSALAVAAAMAEAPEGLQRPALARV